MIINRIASSPDQGILRYLGIEPMNHRDRNSLLQIQAALHRAESEQERNVGSLLRIRPSERGTGVILEKGEIRILLMHKCMKSFGV